MPHEPVPYTRVRDVVVRAARLDGSERARFLDDMCGPDAEFRREAESLLRFWNPSRVHTAQFDGPARALLEDETFECSERTAEVLPGQGAPPDGGVPLVAGYRILGTIGHGGMGTVYEAIQLATHRRVALKVIRHGWLDPSRIRHFQREVEALGRLHHPSIATIHDAGVTEGGRHYYSMELVRGITLKEFHQSQWDAPRTPWMLNLRVHILITLCHTVDFAHRQGVIHRDLKPENVMLVAGALDEKGIEAGGLKVLDFGLARVADSAAAEGATESVAVKGTLRYMSPEQVRGIAAEVDYRSDLYSVGVTAYELLTGALPYCVPIGYGADAIRAITEAIPQRPSDLVPGFPKRLEAILLKSLAKNPADRYQSAADMATDLERFLSESTGAEGHGLPGTGVRGAWSSLARAHRRLPGWAWVLSLAIALGALSWWFARTGDLAVGSLSVLAVAAVVVASVGLTAVAFGTRIRRLKAQGEEEKRKAGVVLSFLQEALLASHPEAKGREATVLDAIERAEERLGTVLAGLPDVEGAILTSIGNVLVGLQEDRRAEAALRRAIDRLRSHYGSDAFELETAEMQLVHVLQRQMDFAGAESLLRRVHDRSARIRGSQNPATVNLRANLAVLVGQQGRLREAIPLYREGLAARERARGPEARATVLARLTLGNALRRSGEYEEAERLLRSTMSSFSKESSAERNLQQARSYLASVLACEGRLEEATRMLETPLGFFLEGATGTGQHLGVCAETLRALERHDDAIYVSERALDRFEQEKGTRDHPFLSDIWFTLGGALSDKGSYMESRRALERGLQNIRRAGGGWELARAAGSIELGILDIRCALAVDPGRNEDRDRLEQSIRHLNEARRRALSVVEESHPLVLRSWLEEATAHWLLSDAAAESDDLSRALSHLPVQPDAGLAPGLWFATAAALLRVGVEDASAAIELTWNQARIPASVQRTLLRAWIRKYGLKACGGAISDRLESLEQMTRLSNQESEGRHA